MFRGDVDPVQLYISIAASPTSISPTGIRCRPIFGRDLMRAEGLSERLSHMTELVLGYVLQT